MSRSFSSSLAVRTKGALLVLSFALTQVGCAADATAWDGADSTDDSADVLRQEQGAEPTSQSASTNGPNKVKSYTSGYRDGPKYADSTIYYPEDLAGPLPAVAIVPGFVSPQSSIQPWGPFLASHGIIAMTIGTNSPADTPPQRSDALLDALETVKSENTRSGSPLSGKVDATRFGVIGWSMGGGGSLIAAQKTPTLKAAISLCGWNPGGTYPNMTVPSLMFGATADPLAGGQATGFYKSIPATTPKLIFEVQGGSHQYANTPRAQSGAVGRFGLSWLKTYLVGDARYKQFLTVKPSGLSQFETNVGTL